jgi:drug/metabolite transporter (DMT)-like permease
MHRWSRRIRAALVMGLMWAAAFFVAGLVLARVPGFFSDVPFAILFAPLGFATGVIFSAILVALASRRRFEQMSLPSLLAGLFGAGATLREEMLGGEVLLFGLVLGSASAACAAGSLALARRAERRELPAGVTPNAPP